MTNEIGSQTGAVGIFGAPVFYEMAGTGRPLVLIHEGIGDSRMYDDQFPALAERYRTVRYDLPGFGRSGKPQIAFTHHEALKALLSHLEIDQTALLGMSLGGGIAVDFTLTYPEIPAALVLIAAGLDGYPPSQQAVTLFAPLAQAFKAQDFVRAIDLSVHLWVDGPDREPEAVDPAVRERVRAMYTDVLRRSKEPGPDPNPLQPPGFTRLKEIRAPTLVVVGTGDVPDVQQQAALLARTIPKARKVELPRLGHVPNMESPTEVNRLVLEYLAEVYPP